MYSDHEAIRIMTDVFSNDKQDNKCMTVTFSVPIRAYRNELMNTFPIALLGKLLQVSKFLVY